MHNDEIYDYGLVLGMQGLLYHTFACMLLNLVSEKTMQMNLSLLVLYVPLVLFTVFRAKCDKFIVFMICHAAVLYAFYFMIPALELRIIICGCVAAMLLCSIHLRMKPQNLCGECPPAGFTVLFLLVYILAGYMKYPFVMQISYYEAFLFLILYAVHRNHKNTILFLQSSQDIMNLPAEQIKGMNRMLFRMFVVFLIAAMFLLQYLPADNLFYLAGQLLLWLLHGIGWLLERLFSREVSESGDDCTAAENMMLGSERYETSALLLILEKIITTAVCIAFIAGVVYVVIRIFYELYKRFYEQQKKPADESEFLWERPLERIRIERKSRKQPDLKASSANRKIRQIYKRSMQRKYGKKRSVPDVMTPAELEEDIAQIRDADTDAADIIQKRTALYEKARYSQHECRKQEIEAMKQYMDKF